MEIKDIFTNLPTLEPERLLLRKITVGDAQDMFQYGSDAEVSRYVTWDAHKTIEDTMEFIGFVLRRYESADLAPWGIVLKETNQLIGTIDFVSWQINHKTAEIGYVIAKNYWGQGITTEAGKELLNYGFKNMNLVRIQARCFIENGGSEGVMKKLWMKYEGTLRKAMFTKGEHRDLKMYAVLKEEFEMKNSL
ncbi:GNAT family N-acetyltransferase [Fictibacillus sp. 23RED33]|uniref:GNAT family N-acetyltransferase n=1 Tax=Fictibacillus sp. 23RED33 TaxID=2745879 RepID=UPI0018CF2BD4|nr:GNAT family protein [Fictibacillus sp. 23RED33]MBH0172416.1 GNAT family N-acetyltransferase [Fictibacillus sp. 23RED33]